MVSQLPIAGAGHRIADKPFCKGGFLKLSSQPEFRIERGFALPVCHKLDTPKQPAPANVANMEILREAAAQL